MPGFEYGGLTILSHPIFIEAVLPFLLVFTIVFAVLEKSKVLGDGKRQIDAIVALITGLIVISFGQAVGIIVQLIPFLGVTLVIILVFMILLGSFHPEGEFPVPKPVKIILMVLVAIAVVVAVFLITGAWDYLFNFVFAEMGSELFINIVFVIVVLAAIVAVMLGSKQKTSSSK